jgi:hypothetical protein
MIPVPVTSIRFSPGFPVMTGTRPSILEPLEVSTRAAHGGTALEKHFRPRFGEVSTRRIGASMSKPAGPDGGPPGRSRCPRG